MSGDLLVTGHRKSGTTLLSNLLNGHPELDVYPEDLCLFYGYYPHHIRTLDDDALAPRLDAVVFDMLAKKAARRGYADRFDVEALRADFWRRLPTDALRSIAPVYRALRDAFQAAHGSEGNTFVGKETSLEIFLPTLRDPFEGAKVVHLVRDPRDNFAAIHAGADSYYAKIGETTDMSLDSLITRVALGTDQIAANRALHGDGGYLVLRFEDLVTDPRATMERLSDFAGIAFDDALLSPAIFGQGQTGNNHSGEKFTAISPKNLGKWPNRIDPWHAKVIEHRLAPMMATFGYEPAFPTAEAAEAAAEWYAGVNYKYYYRDSFGAPPSQAPGTSA